MHFRKITVLAVGLLLTGCAPGADATDVPEASNQQHEQTQADALLASDTWAKAAESGMSAAFGVLHNDSDQPLQLRQVSNALGDEIQIHEMRGTGQDMSMAQLEGDLVIEPGQDAVLAPGGNHFMFMDLEQPLRAAQHITLQLEFADGSSTEVNFAIRNFDGAKESYDEHGHGEH